MNITMKIFFVFSIFLGLILVFRPSIAMGQGAPTFTGPPETIEEIKAMFSKAANALPEAFKTAFKAAWAEATAVWARMYLWFNNWWESKFSVSFVSWLKSWWWKLIDLFHLRETVFNQEFPKEKEEVKTGIKTEVPDYAKYLWEKFKEIIQ